jgi:type II secretion system protein C
MTLPEPATRAVSWILLVGVAFFAADTTAAVIENRLRVAPKSIPVAAVAPLEAGGVPAQAVPPGLNELLATTRPATAAPEQVAAGGDGSTPTSTSSGPPSSLNLRGTMAGVGGSGLAMIDVNGETRVVSVGEEISGMRLAEVGAYWARLEGGGRTQILEMDVATEVAAVPVPPPILPPTDEPTVPADSPTPEATPGAIPEVGATPAAPVGGAILSQTELRNILDNPGQFAGNFRLKPVLREGEIVGMRVNMKDSSHPLARLGVQDGDIVRSLNGQDLNGPEALSSIYRVLRNTSSLKFEVERNGQNQSIDVSLSE